MKSSFATKEDINKAIDEAVGQISRAVLGALDEVAKKEDLKEFATKKDLKEFATQEDLNSGLEGIKNELMYIKMQIRDLDMDTISETDFRKLEKRVGKLEKKANLPLSQTC
ncbi:MAG: hypothetical protein M1514_00695 [Patescibacteria group bacterium]|nr:hypothetical protein [Patescibacteria group bacterium]